MTEKSCVGIPPGAGLFSRLFSILSVVSPQSGHYRGATTLNFKEMLSSGV